MTRLFVCPLKRCREERFTLTPAFAALRGANLIPASSGKIDRHRLNRGGDRQANAALYRVVLVRLRYDERTREYTRRRTREGMTKPEIIRCLKRYVARQVFAIFVRWDVRTWPYWRPLDIYRSIIFP